MATTNSRTAAARRRIAEKGAERRRRIERKRVMERVDRICESYKSESKDTISSMPEKVMGNILDRLSIQDAVSTSVLSRQWRFMWTLLTQLVFDNMFFGSIQRSNGQNPFNSKSLTRILLHIKGSITKFVLYIPVYFMLDVADLSHWLMFLSGKRIKELTLINMHKVSYTLPTHLYSCLNLKHLVLHDWCFHPGPSFGGFPNLVTYEFKMVRFESYKLGDFVSQCPLLETLRLDHNDCMGKLNYAEITKHGNLKKLYLSLSKLDNMAITSSGFIQLLGHLPKLEELALDFQECKFLEPTGAKKRVSASLSLKTLTLYKLDFNSRPILFFAIDLIRGSPNLQTLKITAIHDDCVPLPALLSWEVENGFTAKLQLQIVELECKDSEIELCFIKSLLAYSSCLRKMVINHIGGACASCHGNYMFARKLLKLYRASPIVDIDLC